MTTAADLLKALEKLTPTRVAKAIALDDKTAAGLMLNGASDAIWAAQRALSEGDMAKFKERIGDVLAKVNAVSSGLGGEPAPTEKNTLPVAPYVVASFTPEGFAEYAKSELAKAKDDEKNDKTDEVNKRLAHLHKALRIAKAQFFEGDGKLASGNPLMANVTVETTYAPEGGSVMDLTDTKDQMVKTMTVGKPPSVDGGTLFSANVVKSLENLDAGLAERLGLTTHQWPDNINAEPVAKRAEPVKKKQSNWGPDPVFPTQGNK